MLKMKALSEREAPFFIKSVMMFYKLYFGVLKISAIFERLKSSSIDIVQIMY